MIRIAFTLANNIAKYLCPYAGTSASRPPPSSRAASRATSKPWWRATSNPSSLDSPSSKHSTLGCRTSPAPSSASGNRSSTISLTPRTLSASPRPGSSWTMSSSAAVIKRTPFPIQLEGLLQRTAAAMIIRISTQNLTILTQKQSMQLYTYPLPSPQEHR